MTIETEEQGSRNLNAVNPLRSDCWYGLPFPQFGTAPNPNMTVENRATALQGAFRSHLRYTLAKYLPVATRRNYYHTELSILCAARGGLSVRLAFVTSGDGEVSAGFR